MISKKTRLAAKINATRVEALHAPVIEESLIRLFDRVIERAEQKKSAPDFNESARRVRLYEELIECLPQNQLEVVGPQFIRYIKILGRNHTPSPEIDEVPTKIEQSLRDASFAEEVARRDAYCAVMSGVMPDHPIWQVA